jgi:dihydroneopterin aldolase / 2-amino-4-hydroxy-6-hydroxymethyldihydropteridine diphosphokinase
MRAVLSLGANLGDREASFREALRLLGEAGAHSVRISRFIETEPVGLVDQPVFLNAVALVETDLTPRELLETALDIERRMGRVRLVRWGPRNIDLDILFYENRIIDEDDLKIPHPQFLNRPFFVELLTEIAPDWVDPRTGTTTRSD